MELKDLEEAPSGFTVSINGASVTLAESTTDALREALRSKGVVTFAATVDGEECNDPTELLAAIHEHGTVEIRTYAKPGAHD